MINPYILGLVKQYGEATAVALAQLLAADKAGALATLRKLVNDIEAVPEDAGNDNVPDEG